MVLMMDQGSISMKASAPTVDYGENVKVFGKTGL